MLLRMYLRWAERHGYLTTIMDTSYAEEAGLKSATFEVKAPYASARSASRPAPTACPDQPVRQPGRRQTSFAAVEVILLIEQTDSIDIPDNEIRVTSSAPPAPAASPSTPRTAVRLTHIPTGTVVSMQNEKSAAATVPRPCACCSPGSCC